MLFYRFTHLSAPAQTPNKHKLIRLCYVLKQPETEYTHMVSYVVSQSVSQWAIHKSRLKYINNSLTCEIYDLSEIITARQD